MKTLDLKNDDYLGYVKNLRHACRGILVRDGKVLLSYESKRVTMILCISGLDPQSMTTYKAII